MESELCHTVHPFVQTVFLTNGHCNESLIWFEASGLLLHYQYSNLTETPRITEILQLRFFKTTPFTHSSSPQVG